MQKKGGLLPRETWGPLLLIVGFNMLTYLGSRRLTASRPHYDLTGALDARIPFVPWTVAIYLGCYVFWAVNYVIACRRETKTAFRFFSAELTAKLVCLICFLAFPTTNTRPAIEGHSLWEELMRFLYRVDAADNLFPSIHCLTSWFCVIAVRKNEQVPKWYRRLSLFLAASVCVSTLTTKQHVLADVAAGIALAEGSYYFAGRSRASEWFRKLWVKA